MKEKMQKIGDSAKIPLEEFTARSKKGVEKDAPTETYKPPKKGQSGYVKRK